MTPTRAKVLFALGCGGLGLAACSGSAPSSLRAASPAHPPSLVRLGDDLQRSGDPEGATAIYRAAVGQDGRNSPALERLGATALAEGNPGRAEQAFRAAGSLEGGSANAQRGLAVALIMQGRSNEALPSLKALADRQPSPASLRVFGTALDMAGRQDEAQATYRRGLELAPADPNLHGNLALSLAASGHMDAALGEIRAARLSPVPDPRQDANSVLILAMAGREGEAREQGGVLLGPERTAVLLRQAARVREAADPASRARALGLLTVAVRPEAVRARG